MTTIKVIVENGRRRTVTEVRRVDCGRANCPTSDSNPNRSRNYLVEAFDGSLALVLSSLDEKSLGGTTTDTVDRVDLVQYYKTHGNMQSPFVI